MSIFDRIVHTLKGTVNDALDSTQNIGTEVRQTVRDLDEQLNKAEGALVEVRAQNELLKGKRDAAQKEVDKWLSAAKSAAGKDDALAMECLGKKAVASEKLASLETEIAKFQPTVDSITKQIGELRAQKEGMANQADVISVRSDVADVQLKTAKIMGGVGGSSAETSFANLQESLAKKEARANAAASIVQERTGESLEARVAALNKPDMAAELEALKSAK